MAQKKLSKTIYVYKENEGTADEYYQVEDNIEDCGEIRWN
jgi:hypothetical protein